MRRKTKLSRWNRCHGRDKGPSELNGGSGSFTPLAPAKSLCVVDHLPPTEDIQTPMMSRSEVEQLIGMS
jgi:hypothetical protein